MSYKPRVDGFVTLPGGPMGLPGDRVPTHTPTESRLDCFVRAIEEAAEQARDRPDSCCGTTHDCTLSSERIREVGRTGFVLPQVGVNAQGYLTSEAIREVRRADGFNFSPTKTFSRGREDLTPAEQNFFLYCVAVLRANPEWVRLALDMSIRRTAADTKDWFAELEERVLFREKSPVGVIHQRIDVSKQEEGVGGCSKEDPDDPTIQNTVGAYATRGCNFGCNLTICDAPPGAAATKYAFFFAAGRDVEGAVREHELDRDPCALVRSCSLLLHEFLHLIDRGSGGERGAAPNDDPGTCASSYVLQENFAFLVTNWFRTMRDAGSCGGACGNTHFRLDCEAISTSRQCRSIDNNDDAGRGLWRDRMSTP